MRQQNYSKELQALKITKKWLWTWLSLWILTTVFRLEPPAPLAYFAALCVVVDPVIDLALAPFQRWFERCRLNYRLWRDRRKALKP